MPRTLKTALAPLALFATAFAGCGDDRPTAPEMATSTSSDALPASARASPVTSPVDPLVAALIDDLADARRAKKIRRSFEDLALALQLDDNRAARRVLLHAHDAVREYRRAQVGGESDDIIIDILDLTLDAVDRGL